VKKASFCDDYSVKKLKKPPDFYAKKLKLMILLVYKEAYFNTNNLDFVIPSVAVSLFFFGKLTYVLKEEDTNIIRGIPQIYNDNRNIKQQMATG
jgi:hypothetical protein